MHSSEESICVNGGDFSKIENLLQREGGEKQADWGKNRKSEDYSKWREEESKRVGAKVCKTGRLLQVEGRGKQAGWGKSVSTRKITPRGKKEKEKDG